jgi:hypothetical protein
MKNINLREAMRLVTIEYGRAKDRIIPLAYSARFSGLPVPKKWAKIRDQLREAMAAIERADNAY